jgi:hypothetical protein
MATGQAHRFNVLKYKMLAGLLKAYPEAVTTKELADIIGVDVNSVGVTISRWHKQGIPFIRRMPKQARWGAYRYKINKSGIEAYIAYKNRLNKGFSLNRLRKVPRRVSQYMTVSKWGRDMGLTMDDVDYSLKAFEERLAAA